MLSHFLRLVGVFVIAIGLSPGSLSAKEDDKPAEEKADVPALTDEQAAAIAGVVRELDKETKVDVIETPLEDVLRDISKVHKIKITIDPAGLRRAGVAKDKLVTINEKAISLRGFMPRMLKPLGLTYRVRPDGLLITSIAPEPAKKPVPKD
jgi:hypothetical protein